MTTERYSDPHYVITGPVATLLADTTGIEDSSALTAIFFLLSKSEQDNEAWNKTFMGNDKKPVFFFAERLSYDGDERGVTVGLAGWTTANGGRDTHGDFIKLAERYKRMGGLDLRAESKGLTTNKSKAKRFCATIHKLHGDYADRFVRAQFKELCSPDGYVYEAVHGLRAAGIASPSPLAVAALADTLINQGVGGKYCALKWLREHPSKDESTLLREFLAWKRVTATKNHHNSPPINGERRADMFKQLLEAGDMQLSRAGCERAVRWTMK